MPTEKLVSLCNTRLGATFGKSGDDDTNDEEHERRHFFFYCTGDCKSLQLCITEFDFRELSLAKNTILHPAVLVIKLSKPLRE